MLSKQLHAFKLPLPSSVKNFAPQHLLKCEDAEHDAMHDQLIDINTQLQCPGPILSYVNPEGADAVQLLHMWSAGEFKRLGGFMNAGTALLLACPSNVGWYPHAYGGYDQYTLTRGNTMPSYRPSRQSDSPKRR